MDKLLLKSGTSMSLSDRFSRLQSKNNLMTTRLAANTMQNPSFPILPNSSAALNTFNPNSSPFNKQNRNISAKLRLSLEAKQQSPGLRFPPNKRAITNKQTVNRYLNMPPSQFNSGRMNIPGNARRGGFTGRGGRGGRNAPLMNNQTRKNIIKNETDFNRPPRGISRGRGRARGGQTVNSPKIEDLDKQLDAYMSKTKGYLDNMLEDYHSGGILGKN